MAGFGANDTVVKKGWGANDVASDSGGGFAAQANAGIAESVGGVVDMINPFDKPNNIGGVDMPVTGSAVKGIKDAMDYFKIDVADRPPEGVLEGMGRGTGNAMAAILPVAKGLQIVSTAGGVAGAIATDALASLASVTGLSLEAISGAISGGAREGAEEAGYSKWVQDVVEMGSPLAIPAAAVVGKGAVRLGGKYGTKAYHSAAGVAKKVPGVGLGVRVAEGAGNLAKGAIKDVKRAVVPMTEGGAHEVASARAKSLVGGDDRAVQLGRQLEAQSDLNLTPAHQLQDPNLIALEKQAAHENPLLRERLTARESASRAEAQSILEGMGGDVKDARKFITKQLNQAKASMNEKMETQIELATKAVNTQGSTVAESNNSARMVEGIKSALTEELTEEKRLWGLVPKGAKVSTANTRGNVKKLIDDGAWAQRGDIPNDLRTAFGEDGVLGDETTVKELHGLYSEMRRVSRSAMAGTDTNPNKARIANAVADAILDDLGAKAGKTPVGKAINDARTYSRALHETFDQGAVGDILKRNIEGGEAIAPEAALKRTIGRGGVQAKVDADDIRKASPSSQVEMQEHLRAKFLDSAFNEGGDFTPEKAKAFFRENRELLKSFPAMRKEITGALHNRSVADAFVVKSAARAKLIAMESSPARFNVGQEEKAVLSILGADDPVRTARTIVSTAKKDPTGAALAGVKDAFTGYLIKNSVNGEFSGKQFKALMNDKKLGVAMRQVFSNAELNRMNRLSTEISKLDAVSHESVSSVLDSPANQLIELVVRVSAGRHGGKFGGGSLGGSMQTANIFSTRARKALHNLTNNTAREMLMDAIEDPALFRALLLEPKKMNIPKSVRSKLAPYLTGAAANVGEEENE